MGSTSRLPMVSVYVRTSENIWSRYHALTQLAQFMQSFSLCSLCSLCKSLNHSIINLNARQPPVSLKKKKSFLSSRVKTHQSLLETFSADAEVDDFET